MLANASHPHLLLHLTDHHLVHSYKKNNSNNDDDSEDESDSEDDTIQKKFSKNKSEKLIVIDSTSDSDSSHNICRTASTFPGSSC